MRILHVGRHEGLWKNTDTMGQGYVTGSDPGTSHVYITQRWALFAWLFKEHASVVVPANMTFETASLNRLSVHSRKDRRRLDGIS
jgi:hypothetical protein